jgi:hypothetical protein
MRILFSCLSVLLVAAGPAKDFRIGHEGKIYSYDYAWPAQAVAIPALDKTLEAEMVRNRSGIISLATAASKDARSSGGHFPDGGYESSWTWRLAGETARLLSLDGESYAFTGGAHGNPAAMALLWDRVRNRQITVAELFRRPADYAALRPSYCAGLQAERRKKRGGSGTLATLPEFDQCPKLSDLVVGIVDEDGDGRFEAVRFTANPYLAGPYLEGIYVVDLPATSTRIAALKPQYRSSFEPQRQ